MAKKEKDQPEIQDLPEALDLAAGKNEFLPFAFQSTSNVIDQKTYEALQERLSGFVSGVALAERLNKVWRQSSIMSAALGQFLAASTGKDVIDDGDINKLVALLNESIAVVAPGKVISVNGKQGVVTLTYTDVGAAPLKDAHLQGQPTAPTPKAGDSSDNLATTAFVANAIGSIDAVPKGCIVMWSGARANIPGGWHLCDGNNGTPNLVGRFILGGADKGTAGGSAKISIEQMPAHSHTGSTAGAGGHTHGGSAAASGNHSHGGSTAGAGGHSHGVSDGGHDHGYQGPGGGVGGNGAGTSTSNRRTDRSGAGVSIQAVGDHEHGLSIAENGTHSHGLSIDAVGDHSHNVSLNNTGGGADYLPPYFQLCYIMKA